MFHQGIVTNGKRLRFDLKGQLGDVILSRNARAILENGMYPAVFQMHQVKQLYLE
jgi:hypothetical protein